ncbi:MAG: hypothetical protein E7170_01565 [Firmicutes bacterium]|nr:hypothetical protein [Bacillota bacterium]
MEVKIGKVIEVFIPDNNIESKQIGFKVLIDNEEVNIIQEQDYNNANILKSDLVEVRKQIIDNNEYLDIELYEVEDYE